MIEFATIPALIRSLQNPSVYPHPADDVLLIETHISWVILAGDYAYKIKKTLDLGFLDFSSLEKRRHFCLEELRLNSRLAPEIYLDVVAIRGSEAEPNFKSGQKVIEYAVKMRRFDHTRTFDHLLRRQLLQPRHVRRTAQLIADFHARIARAPIDACYGRPASVIQPVRENFSQIERLQGIEHPALLAALAIWSEHQFDTLQPLLQQRKNEGYVRECHGDLHLGNIVLVDDTPVPFDGIEFNPSLYWIDVISEVAFLVMDLCDNLQSDLAFCFLNDYLQLTGDYAALKLLRFYLVYRAMVRAKVNAIRACQSDGNDSHRAAIDAYHAYLALANDFTRPSPPRLFLMHGVSGSGKSWLSERMLKRLPAIRIRSDVERKRLFAPSSPQPDADALGQGLYTTDVTLKTYARLLRLAKDILESGFNVIVDAAFLQREQRRPFFELAEKVSLPITLIDTVADQATLDRRLLTRTRRQDNVSDAGHRVLHHQMQNLEPLTEAELNYTYRIDTGDARRLADLWTYLDEFKH